MVSFLVFLSLCLLVLPIIVCLIAWFNRLKSNFVCKIQNVARKFQRFQLRMFGAGIYLEIKRRIICSEAVQQQGGRFDKTTHTVGNS